MQQQRQVTHKYGTSSDSTAVQLSNGVPQGLPISPLFFMLISEIVLRAAALDNSGGVQVGQCRIQTQTFVDDTECTDFRKNWS